MIGISVRCHTAYGGQRINSRCAHRFIEGSVRLVGTDKIGGGFDYSAVKGGDTVGCAIEACREFSRIGVKSHTYEAVVALCRGCQKGGEAHEFDPPAA